MDLKQDQKDGIEKDLEKIDRHFRFPDAAFTRVRVTNGQPANVYHAVIEIDYHRRHFIASGDATDVGMAVREAREDVLRQITDVSRRGHSSYTKNG
jgi:ribosome-associated translation inhibitor RaiA